MLCIFTYSVLFNIQEKNDSKSELGTAGRNVPAKMTNAKTNRQ